MNKSKYRRWTKEEDELLVLLYQKKTLRELGKVFDRHWNKVGRRAVRLGLKKDRETVAKMISKTQKKLFANGKRTHKGKKNPNWKGGRERRYGGVSCGLYNTVHDWLKKNYGKADMCQNPNCSEKSKNYQWAKKLEKKYEKKRANFFMLCAICHSNYDKENGKY